MKTLETKRMEMCIRVCESRPEFPLAGADDAPGADSFDKLGLAVERIRSASYEQSRAQSALRENSTKVDATRAELERQLEAIRRTVRVTGLPGLENKFLPARNVNDQGLITLARTYGNDAFPIKADLIKRALGADFINDLAVAAQAFDEAIKERPRLLNKQSEATTELDSQIDDALRIVRELGVIVSNVYANDPTKLALWETVSHVEKAGRRHGAGDDDNNNQPPPPAQS
ncbi:MAG: hypothetical protein JOZ02_16040 [Acidobacteria bacterium]|nr:hypothetical protein [Acidobacteriota bacterium]